MSVRIVVRRTAQNSHGDTLTKSVTAGTTLGLMNRS